MARPLARLRAFGRREDGSMVIFGMFIFVMMLIVAGMAVDIMRFESTRSRLQGTLDRAVLAAADLDQARDCETVVRDYFSAAGLLDELNNVNCVETINSREVSADADLGMDTLFLKLAGVDQLDAPAAGTAQEEVSDIEIVLVLDVSGSMNEASGGSTKIALLRTAARDFVETVMANDTDKRISIAIVPFNAQVNLGPTMFNGLVAEGYGITNRHGTANSFCLDLPASAYAQPSIARGLSIPQAGYFDGTSSTTQSHTAYTAPQAPTWNGTNPFCRTETANIVRLPSQNVSTMRTQLQGLSANGNTSITMGMKWANFLLDPSSAAFYDRVSGTGATQIPTTANMVERPYAYDRPNTLKIVVVMTDGEHVSSLVLDPGYRTELAPIYRIGTTTATYQYSIFRDRPSTAFDYYVPSLNLDVTASPATAPAFTRNSLDDDRDGTADDNLPGGWRMTPFDGTADEDIDGQQTYRNAANQLVPIPICQDNNWDNRNDVTGASPCDDDDRDDDGRDDGDDADGDVDVDGSGQAVTQVTWNQLWAHVRVSWVAWTLYAKSTPTCAVPNVAANNTCRTNAYNAWMSTATTAPQANFMTETVVANMNSTLQQSCAQARGNGVIVYGIAFEAPANGRDQIFRCASSPSHYYDAQGLDITNAFRAIAAQINALRLTN